MYFSYFDFASQWMKILRRLALLCLSVFWFLGTALPLAAQVTNTLYFPLASLGYPGPIFRVSLQAVSPQVINGAFYINPSQQFSALSYPTITNGYLIVSNQISGIPTQITISGYTDFVTNYCIPNNATTNAYGYVLAGNWVGVWNSQTGQFYWSNPSITNYVVTVTNTGAIYVAGSGITISSNIISLYAAPTITAFANNQNSVEIGTTVNSTALTWTLGGGTATNQYLDNGIGVVSIASRSYTDTASYTSSRTYHLGVTDGVTTNTAATSINFYSKEYWGASSQVAGSITDAQIIALSGSAFATSRTTTQTIATSSTYMYFCYPAAFGAATFTVNGFPDTGWTLVTRNFVNASGASVSYNIYQHTLATIGSFVVQVQ